MTDLQWSIVGYLMFYNQDNEYWQIKVTLLDAKKRCFLTIHSFLRDGKLSGQQAIQSRLIASVRIKVENAIKWLKDFKIFSDTLCNCTNKKQIDDMLIVACALCNLKPRLTNN